MKTAKTLAVGVTLLQIALVFAYLGMAVFGGNELYYFGAAIWAVAAGFSGRATYNLHMADRPYRPAAEAPRAEVINTLELEEREPEGLRTWTRDDLRKDPEIADWLEFVDKQAGVKQREEAKAKAKKYTCLACCEKHNGWHKCPGYVAQELRKPSCSVCRLQYTGHAGKHPYSEPSKKKDRGLGHPKCTPIVDPGSGAYLGAVRMYENGMQTTLDDCVVAKRPAVVEPKCLATGYAAGSPRTGN